jgi:hypothetical protein
MKLEERGVFNDILQEQFQIFNGSDRMIVVTLCKLPVANTIRIFGEDFNNDCHELDNL